MGQVSSMPGDILDNRTRSFLATTAATLGFIGEHHQRFPLIEECGSIEEWVGQAGKLELQGGTATVYELPESAEEQLGLDEDVLPLPGTAESEANPNLMVPADGFYAVECNSDIDDEKLSFTADTTLLFNHLCTGEEVAQALTLRSIEHRLRFGNLSTQYECEYCGDTVHWLDIPRGEPLDEITLRGREILVEQGACGCSLPPALK